MASMPRDTLVFVFTCSLSSIVLTHTLCVGFFFLVMGSIHGGMGRHDGLFFESFELSSNQFMNS
jgi:hypothetical protein